MHLKRWHIILIYILAGWLFPEAFCGESIRRTGRPRVGLVLSGGGAKGMAHVGALKVIEELGIPIDYIGGTSMGSIVGGLYAIGYTSTQLETYMRETDWAYLFTGKVLRRNVSIYEKGERKRYWLQFAVTGGRINLPLGILRGQNVSNLLTELASPAYAQMDFSKLPVPFLCIATDIASGTEVVLEHGDLARAIRASMAIPSVFTPENIDGHNLYDGGLVNNFPADKLRDKGMDILIGVDVTSPAGETELNNIYQVMEQVVFMASLPLKEANKKLCRILITPDITGYGASSFGAADSLIARGERAARQQYGALKALADSLRSFETGEPGEHGLCSQPLPSFYVRDVKIKGLKHISEDFFMQKLKLEAPAVTTFQELDKAIERLNGTQVFESVVYRLNPLPDGEVELQFDCIEQGTNLFRVGLHYDREYKASLLLNQTYRNILLNNSKALIDVAIGENPSFMLSYFHSPGLKPVGKTLFKSTLSPDWQFYINGYMIDAYNYTGKQRTSAYSVSSLNTGIQLMITPSVNSVIGSGVHGAYTMIDNRVGGEDEDIKSNYLYLNYNFFYERDTYNQDYFPTQGGKFRLTASYNKGVSKNVRYSDGFFGVVFRSNLALTPIHRWTIHSGIDAGSMFGTDIPPHFMMYLGGNPGKHWRNELDFSGMYFMQKYAENAWAIHLNNQVCLWSNIYLIFRVNLGKTEPEFADMFTLKDFWAGYGVSLQYNSVVGPLGFTFSSSNATHSLTGAINIGFWF